MAEGVSPDVAHTQAREPTLVLDATYPQPLDEPPIEWAVRPRVHHDRDTGRV
jgi:hypothetical protein